MTALLVSSTARISAFLISTSPVYLTPFLLNPLHTVHVYGRTEWDLYIRCNDLSFAMIYHFCWVGFIISRINQFHLLSSFSHSFFCAPLASISLPPPPRYSPPPPLPSFSSPYVSLILPLSVVGRFGLGNRPGSGKLSVLVRFRLEPTFFLLLLQKLWFVNTFLWLGPDN